MNKIEKQDNFTFWKRPWYKWVVLAAAILQLLDLLINIYEYVKISAIGILSPSEWADYAPSQIWQCAMNGVLIICFWGVFFIGVFAKSQKSAWLAESVVLFILSFACLTSGFPLHLFSLSFKGFCWLFILLLSFAEAVRYFLKYKKAAECGR